MSTRDTDEFVELRLRRLGIEFEICHPESERVKGFYSRVLGTIRPLTIGWGRGYWIARGKVPIEVARWIYAADIEKVIRVGGHCRAPSPDEYGCEWFDAEGRNIVVDPDGEQRRQFATIDLLRDVDLSMHRFVKSLDEVPDRRGVVDCYHIDTDEGLARFVAMVRHAGLTR